MFYFSSFAHLAFSQGKIIKTYKRTTRLFVCLFFCYFSNPVTTCMATWRAKRGSARARRIDYRFFCRVCQKSVYPKLQNLATFFCWVCVSLLLLDSLNLFWLCTTIVPVIVCVWFVFIPKNGTKTVFLLCQNNGFPGPSRRTYPSQSRDSLSASC